MDVRGPLRKSGWHLQPWAGLIGAVLGWALSDQIGSNSVFDECWSGTPLYIGILGLAGIAIAGAGALLSWRLWRRREGEPGARAFVALVGILAALLFSIAILFQTLAGFIIPGCVG